MSAADRTAAIGLFGKVSVTLLVPHVEIVDRRPIRTRESQPYHAAQGLELPEAEALIQRVAAESEQRAAADWPNCATTLHRTACAWKRRPWW